MPTSRQKRETVTLNNCIFISPRNIMKYTILVTRQNTVEKMFFFRIFEIINIKTAKISKAELVGEVS